jgi:hypothetical protein
MSKKIILLLLGVFSIFIANAQRDRTYKEIGIMAGPTFFQGDFGERRAPSNTYKNFGFSASMVYYLSLNLDRSSFAENFKVRFDLSGMTVNMQHFGTLASSNNDLGQKLSAMRSDIKMGSLGVQLEYFPWKTNDYTDATWSPYIATGGQINSYSAEAYSYLGNIGNPNVVPAKYVDGFKSTSGTAFSVTGSLGVRYKLSDYNYLIFEGQLRYFFDDWIDGMNPDRRTYKENNTNDFSGTMNVGYVYYFN